MLHNQPRMALTRNIISIESLVTSTQGLVLFKGSDFGIKMPFLSESNTGKPHT